MLSGYEEGYGRGYEAGFRHASDITRGERDFVLGSFTAPDRMAAPVKKAQKAKRKASAYSKRYGQMFRKVAPKYKLKSGAWAKDGFKRAQKAAHRLAKK